MLVPGERVPLLVKAPVMIGALGKVRVPLETVILLNVVLELPAIAVVPLKVTVPELCVKVPLLVRVPKSVSVPEGAARLLVELIVILLNVKGSEPLIIDVPLKITVPEPGVNVPSLIQFAFTVNELGGVTEPVIVIL